MSDRDPRAAEGSVSPEGVEAMKNVENNRSVFNPTDMAAFYQQGQARPDMTVGQYMENIFGVKWEDPLQKLVVASQKQLQNRSNVGKAKNIAKGAQQLPGQQPGGMFQANRPRPQGGGQGGGLDELMNRMETE